MKKDDEILNNLSKYLNSSQLKAVEKCFVTDQFVNLVIGPPGCGKTEFLIGTISYLYQYYLKEFNLDK